MPWIEIESAVRFSAEKFVKAKLFESECMFVDVYCLEPGQQQKVHAHDDVDKVYLPLSGSPTVILGDEQRVLTASQAAWAPAGTPHGVRNEGTEPATVLVFQARRDTPQQA